ncbi:MAG: hypothetical protein H7Y13_03745 [Sphingobacteriaceae bacterium]|nr:hypothetical protein [Sphingobacteriaceae bacterium]
MKNLILITISTILFYASGCSSGSRQAVSNDSIINENESLNDWSRIINLPIYGLDASEFIIPRFLDTSKFINIHKIASKRKSLTRLSNQASFLGFTLSNELNWKNHYNLLIKEKVLDTMYEDCSSRSVIHFKINENSYLIEPAIFSDGRKIEQLTFSFHSPTYSSNDAKAKYLDEVIEKLVDKYGQKYYITYLEPFTELGLIWLDSYGNLIIYVLPKKNHYEQSASCELTWHDRSVGQLAICSFDYFLKDYKFSKTETRDIKVIEHF